MAVEYQGELERRKAVLRRFRELLVQQREKFDHYLVVLDHEKTDIETGDIDKLVSHVELEEQIVSEIYTFQKVIDPLEDLYRASYPAGEASGESSEVPELKDTLVELRDEVLARNAENRVLLKRRMMSSFIICGLFAGLAGAVQVTAVYHRLIPSISSGYGYLGFMVAMLVNYKAIWAAPVALFFAALNVGSIQLPIMLRVDSSLAGVIQGTLVLFVILGKGVEGKLLKKTKAIK